MKLLDRLSARRRRKAHERYVLEREWQRKLTEQDTHGAVQGAAEGWAAGGQATSSGN
jgi:hypothetical protein